MKKLLILLLITLFSFSLFAQKRELSDYEKYRIDKEKELYTELDTNKIDTVYIVVEQEAEPVIVNNYYNDYNQPNVRFFGGFGYLWGYNYQSYYSYYNPFYYDYWYGYYPYSYPYYRHNHYYRNCWYGNHYYRHNYYNYSYYSRPRGRHYASSSALGRNRNYYQPYNKTYNSGYTPKKKAVIANRPATKQSPIRVSNSRIDTKRNSLRYNRPISRSRAPYNNTKVIRNRTTTRTQAVQPQRQQQRSNYTRPSSNTRQRNYSPSRSSSSRSYGTPSRAPSRSYSTPSRSSGSRSYSTPSRSRAPSRSYSTPSRSSGSRSYSTPSRSSSSRSSGRR